MVLPGNIIPIYQTHCTCSRYESYHQPWWLMMFPKIRRGVIPSAVSAEDDSLIQTNKSNTYFAYWWYYNQYAKYVVLLLGKVLRNLHTEYAKYALLWLGKVLLNLHTDILPPWLIPPLYLPRYSWTRYSLSRYSFLLMHILYSLCIS